MHYDITANKIKELLNDDIETRETFAEFVDESAGKVCVDYPGCRTIAQDLERKLVLVSCSTWQCETHIKKDHGHHSRKDLSLQRLIGGTLLYLSRLLPQTPQGSLSIIPGQRVEVQVP